MHISEQEENTQVDFKAESDLQTARENDSSRGGRDLGWKSSVCHKVPLLILEDPEDPCKSGGAGEGHRCPAQFSGVLELLLMKRKMGLGEKKKQPTNQLQKKPKTNLVNIFLLKLKFASTVFNLNS